MPENNLLDNIRIVLVNTSHPGNIGSAARAMKTMGLKHLYLVVPEKFPHHKANELASNAGDLLENAVVTSTIEEAIAGCQLILGTSTRERTIPWPLLTSREMGDKLKQESPQTKIAILFGREESGLSNDELHKCHYHIQIPANPEYSSLNLASAVQVISYELRMASLQTPNENVQWDYEWSDGMQVEKFFEHLERLGTLN